MLRHLIEQTNQYFIRQKKEWTEAMLPVVSDDGPDGGVEMQSPTPLQAATHAASSAPASPNLCRRAATSTSGGSGGAGGLQVVTPAPQQLPLPALIGATISMRPNDLNF